MSGSQIRVETRVRIPISVGNAEFLTFKGFEDQREHFAVHFPQEENSKNSPVLVRIHSECVTGDIFGSRKCDCGDQLEESLKLFSEFGGLLIYLRQEGRGIGLNEKLRAYELQNQGLDTFEANRALGHKDDARSFQAAVDILRCLRIHSLILYSNNPDKELALRMSGIDVVAVRSTGVYLKKENLRYLEAKRQFSGHRISFEGAFTS